MLPEWSLFGQLAFSVTHWTLLGATKQPLWDCNNGSHFPLHFSHPKRETDGFLGGVIVSMVGLWAADLDICGTLRCWTPVRWLMQRPPSPGPSVPSISVFFYLFLCDVTKGQQRPELSFLFVTKVAGGGIMPENVWHQQTATPAKRDNNERAAFHKGSWSTFLSCKTHPQVPHNTICLSNRNWLL